MHKLLLFDFGLFLELYCASGNLFAVRLLCVLGFRLQDFDHLRLGSEVENSSALEFLQNAIFVCKLIYPTSVTIPDHPVKAVFRGQPVQILLLVDCRIFPSRARCCGACAFGAIRGTQHRDHATAASADYALDELDFGMTKVPGCANSLRDENTSISECPSTSVTCAAL
jgi:hypothetical protein